MPKNLHTKEHCFLLAFFSAIFIGAYGAAPSVQLSVPNGGEYLRSEYTIGFYVRDPDIASNANGNLWIDIFYSSTRYGFSNSIVNDGNLFNSAIFKCDDTNFQDFTYCTYTWNTASVIDGNYYIDLNIHDDSDLNAIDSSDSSFMVDNNKPTTTDNAPSGWQSSSFTVTLTCLDTKSGCQTTYYRVDSGSWQTGTSVAIADDGNHQIDYYSVDRAGNQESQKTCYAALRAGSHTFSVGVNLDGNYRTYSLYIPSFINGTQVNSVTTQTITAGPNIDYAAFEGTNSLFAIVSTGACNEINITNVVATTFNLYAKHSWRPGYAEEFFFVFSPATHNDIEKNRVAIRNNEFLKRVSPVFGYAAKSAYKVQTGLDYSHSSIDINSDLHLGPGTHSLIIENKGKVNDRVVIEITRG